MDKIVNYGDANKILANERHDYVADHGGHFDGYGFANDVREAMTNPNYDGELEPTPIDEYELQESREELYNNMLDKKRPEIRSTQIDQLEMDEKNKTAWATAKSGNGEDRNYYHVHNKDGQVYVNDKKIPKGWNVGIRDTDKNKEYDVLVAPNLPEGVKVGLQSVGGGVNNIFWDDTKADFDNGFKDWADYMPENKNAEWNEEHDANDWLGIHK